MIHLSSPRCHRTRTTKALSSESQHFGDNKLVDRQGGWNNLRQFLFCGRTSTWRFQRHFLLLLECKSEERWWYWWSDMLREFLIILRDDIRFQACNGVHKLHSDHSDYFPKCVLHQTNFLSRHTMYWTFHKICLKYDQSQLQLVGRFSVRMPSCNEFVLLQ